jgi:hypothetical protein
MPARQARAERWEGTPGARPRITSSLPCPVRARPPPSRRRLLPVRPEAWSRAIPSPEATAQSAHREAASTSAFASAGPARPGVKPRSTTAWRIQDSAESALSMLVPALMTWGRDRAGADENLTQVRRTSRPSEHGQGTVAFRRQGNGRSRMMKKRNASGNRRRSPVPWADHCEPELRSGMLRPRCGRGPRSPATSRRILPRTPGPTASRGSRHACRAPSPPSRWVHGSHHKTERVLFLQARV